MSYGDYIKKLKSDWVGKRVLYEGISYNVVDVDSNGFLLIDKPSTFNSTTAISTYKAAL